MPDSVNNQLLLAIDVGNSRIKYGLFIDDISDKTNRLPYCSCKMTTENDEPLDWKQLLADVPQEKWGSVQSVIAGANGEEIETLQNQWHQKLSAAKIINQPCEVPIENNTDEPAKVGIDRLLNGVAVNQIRTADNPAIIIDSGTATTIDLVSANGAFAGGAILPGLKLSALSLHRYTKQLPLLSMEELTTLPDQPYGKNTFAALQSGIVIGQIGAIKEIVLQIQSTLTTKATLYLTGGGAELLASHFENALYLPDLSLQGLALTAPPFELN